MNNECSNEYYKNVIPYILRALTCWCIASLYCLGRGKNFFSIDSVISADIIKYLSCFLLSYIIFTAISFVDKNHVFDAALFLVIINSFAVYMVMKNSNIYFLIGILVFLVLFFKYYFEVYAKLLCKLTFSKSEVMFMMGFMSCIYMLFTAGISIYRYKTYTAGCYDFGIFSQMFYYMKETFRPDTTCERSKLLSHFAIHLSPIYYLILPIYMVFQSPYTLLIVQPMLVVAGIIPLYLICRKYELSYGMSGLIGVIYCLYPALTGGCLYDFHENKFLTVLILWMIYFYEKERDIPMYIFMVLTFFVKEDAAIYVVAFALYIFFSRKEYKKGIIMFASSIAYFGFACWYVNSYGEGVMSGRFRNFISDDSLGVVSIIKTILINPAYLFSEVFTLEKVEYIILMFLPVAFIPFITKKTSRYLLLIPMLLINLMPDYEYQHSINFQYTFGVAAFIFYMFVVNISEYDKRKVKKSILLFSFVAALLTSISQIHSKTIYYVKYYAEKEMYDTMDEIIAEVPDNASVKASSYIAAHMTHRDELYIEKYADKLLYTDYVLLDLREGIEDDIYSVMTYYEDNGYTVVEEVEGVIVVLVKN